jgi:hypothetical protein
MTVARRRFAKSATRDTRRTIRPRGRRPCGTRHDVAVIGQEASGVH